MSRIW